MVRIWLRTNRLSDNHIYTYFKIAKSEVPLQKTVLEMPQRVIKMCDTGYKKSSGRKEDSRKVEIYEDFYKTLRKEQAEETEIYVETPGDKF